VCLSLDSITDNAQIDVELSRASATEIAVNGAQQCVLQCTLRNNFVTSGMCISSLNQFFPVDVSFAQGQILYLHSVVVGTVVYYATFVLTFA